MPTTESEQDVFTWEATDDEAGAIVEMGRRMAAEAPRWKAVAYEDQRLLGFLRQLIASPTGVAITARRVAAGPAGSIIGFLVGTLAPDWFSGLPYAVPLAIYVPPEHRSRGVARALVSNFESWARRAGAAEIYLGTHTGVEEAGFAALAERLGYAHAGVTLHKRL